jgi:hypothetical protein
MIVVAIPFSEMMVVIMMLAKFPAGKKVITGISILRVPDLLS